MLGEIELSPHPSCCLLDYGFIRCFAFPPTLSRITLIGLGHLQKLSCACEFMDEFRTNTLNVIQQFGDIRDFKTLLTVLRKKVPLNSLINLYQKETFVGKIGKAYELLYNSHKIPGQTDFETEKKFLFSLKIRLFTFRNDANLICSEGNYRAIYVTLSLGSGRQCILVHENELMEGSLREGSGFPFVYTEEGVERKEKGRVMMGILDSLEEVVGGKVVLHADSGRNRWKLKRNISEIPEIVLIYCDICHINREDCKKLPCNLHYACMEDYTPRCSLCYPAREVYQRSTDDSVLSNVPSSEVSQKPVCGICRREASLSPVVEVGKCACLCKSCWESYLNTYVLLPERISCLKHCGVTVSRDTVIQVLKLQVERCAKCNGIAMVRKPVPNCSKPCRCCLLCALEVSGNPENPQCEVCGDTRQSSTTCCKRQAGAVTIAPCGHQVHNTCLQRNQNCCEAPHPNRI